jgi:uncharacterized protein (TIGR03067 family)
MASQNDLAPLQGAWRLLVIEADGQLLEWRSDEKKIITIDGDKWVSFSESRNVTTRCRFAVDPARHRFDFLIGPGVTSPGIYELQGDRLLICTNQRALRRAIGYPIEGDEHAAPASLSAPSGSGCRLWILERD